MEKIVEKLADMYPGDYSKDDTELFKKSAVLKYRDILVETCKEYQRRGEFVRIYPAKNSKIYEKYFSRHSVSKIVYKALFGPELIPYPDQPMEKAY